MAQSDSVVSHTSLIALLLGDISHSALHAAAPENAVAPAPADGAYLVCEFRQRFLGCCLVPYLRCPVLKPHSIQEFSWLTRSKERQQALGTPAQTRERQRHNPDTKEHQDARALLGMAILAMHSCVKRPGKANLVLQLAFQEGLDAAAQPLDAIAPSKYLIWSLMVTAHLCLA